MKYKIIACIIVFTMLFTTSCKKSDINIGFSGGLTGNNSELAKSGMYGAILALEEINNNGGINGHKLNLIIKDDKSDAKHALENDKQLKNARCVAIVGHFISSMAELSVPFANANDILMISPTITTNQLSGINDNFIRLAPSVSIQAISLYDQIIKDKKSNVVVFYSEDNMTYAGALANMLVENFQKKGSIKYKKIGFNKQNPLNVSANRNIISTGSSDATVIIASADDTALFCQSLYQNNIKVDKYCSTWAMTGDLISHGGKSVEGMKGVNFVNYASSSPEFIKFRNAYVNKYKIEPDFSSIYSYEAIKILEYALKNVKNINTTEIINAILNKGKFAGVQSEFSLDKFGDCNRKMFICKIVNSQLVAIND